MRSSDNCKKELSQLHRRTSASKSAVKSQYNRTVREAKITRNTSLAAIETNRHNERKKIIAKYHHLDVEPEVVEQPKPQLLHL